MVIEPPVRGRSVLQLLGGQPVVSTVLSAVAHPRETGVVHVPPVAPVRSGPDVCLPAASASDAARQEVVGGEDPAAELIDSGHFGGAEIYDIVCRLNEHGLSIRATPGGHVRLPSERNREMLRLRLVEGLTLAEIGKRTGVSQERVRQLLNLHFGLWGKRT
jgi:hypothetical protein